MADDYQRIAEAIRYLRMNTLEQPSLDQVAAQAGLSPHHFQRTFRRWVGISPKRFLQFLTANHAKQLLRQSQPVLDTSFAVGLSSPGRLHDLLINIDAVTPGEYKDRGQGMLIEYGQHPTPFGESLIATTSRGICHLAFLETNSAEAELDSIRKDWPKAQLLENSPKTAPLIEQIFNPGPEDIVEDNWYAFWSPFRSEIAANGFVAKLQETTGIDYRVVKVKTGVYEVAFAYVDDADIQDKLARISSATGLNMTDS